MYLHNKQATTIFVDIIRNLSLINTKSTEQQEHLTKSLLTQHEQPQLSLYEYIPNLKTTMNPSGFDNN